jgi:hypothetical protein
MYTGLAIVYAGSTTNFTPVPNIPRLPMFPDQNIERTWLEYFRGMHNLLADHIADNTRHG